jgi:hypothetical protein
MQSLPGSALEVIETEFFFQLRLLANPSCLDGSGQGAQVSLRRQVGARNTSFRVSVIFTGRLTLRASRIATGSA